MSCNDSPKVVIRLEVAVEGGEARLRFGRKKFRFKHGEELYGLTISTPQTSSPASPKNTTVTQTGGENYVAASGTATGTGTCRVWALAYPTTNPSPPDNPPSNAVTTLASGGNWSFSAVPGSGYDSIFNNPYNNSTIVVWYQCPAGSGTINKIPKFYHGYVPSMMGAAYASEPGPACLTATFSGALEKLGSVTLTREGSTWVSRVAGVGADVQLTSFGGELRLVVYGVGAGGVAVATGKQTEHAPFQWTGYGVVVGDRKDEFKVTVSE
jgi:hypothetical protein